MILVVIHHSDGNKTFLLHSEDSPDHSSYLEKYREKMEDKLFLGLDVHYVPLKGAYEEMLKMSASSDKIVFPKLPDFCKHSEPWEFSLAKDFDLHDERIATWFRFRRKLGDLALFEEAFVKKFNSFDEFTHFYFIQDNLEADKIFFSDFAKASPAQRKMILYRFGEYKTKQLQNDGFVFLIPINLESWVGSIEMFPYPELKRPLLLFKNIKEKYNPKTHLEIDNQKHKDEEKTIIK